MNNTVNNYRQTPSFGSFLPKAAALVEKAKVAGALKEISPEDLEYLSKHKLAIGVGRSNCINVEGIGLLVKPPTKDTPHYEATPIELLDRDDHMYAFAQLPEYLGASLKRVLEFLKKFDSKTISLDYDFKLKSNRLKTLNRQLATAKTALRPNQERIDNLDRQIAMLQPETLPEVQDYKREQLIRDLFEKNDYN